MYGKPGCRGSNLGVAMRLWMGRYWMRGRFEYYNAEVKPVLHRWATAGAGRVSHPGSLRMSLIACCRDRWNSVQFDHRLQGIPCGT